MSLSTIRKLTESELGAAYGLLKQLRTQLSEDEFFATYRAAHAETDYNFWGAFSETRLVGLMGARLLHDYVHGRHLYIDDLVVDKNVRSQGIGAQLLAFSETLARDLGCRGLRLCTGVDQTQAQAFYQREGWNARALAYKKPLQANPTP